MTVYFAEDKSNWLAIVLGVCGAVAGILMVAALCYCCHKHGNQSHRPHTNTVAHEATSAPANQSSRVSTNPAYKPSPPQISASDVVPVQQYGLPMPMGQPGGHQAVGHQPVSYVQAMPMPQSQTQGQPVAVPAVGFAPINHLPSIGTTGSMGQATFDNPAYEGAAAPDPALPPPPAYSQLYPQLSTGRNATDPTPVDH